MLPSLDYDYTKPEAENIKRLLAYSGYPENFLDDIVIESVDRTRFEHPEAMMILRFPSPEHPLAQVNGSITREQQVTLAPITKSTDKALLNVRTSVERIHGIEPKELYQRNTGAVLDIGADITMKPNVFYVNDALQTEFSMDAKAASNSLVLYGTAKGSMKLALDTGKVNQYNKINNTVFLFSPYFEKVKIQNPVTGSTTSDFAERFPHPYYGSVRKVYYDSEMVTAFQEEAFTLALTYHNQYPQAGYTNSIPCRMFARLFGSRFNTETIGVVSEEINPTPTLSPIGQEELSDMHKGMFIWNYKGVPLNEVALQTTGEMSELTADFECKMLRTGLFSSLKHFRFGNEAPKLKYNLDIVLPDEVEALGTDWTDMQGTYDLLGSSMSFNTEKVPFSDLDTYREAVLQAIAVMVNTEHYRPRITVIESLEDNISMTVRCNVEALHQATDDTLIGNYPVGQESAAKTAQTAFHDRYTVGSVTFEFTNTKHNPTSLIPEVLPGFIS